MQVQVFYFIAAQGLDVSADEGVTISIQDVISELMPQLQGDEDFLGLVDMDDNTLQMAPHGPDVFWVEIPAPERQGSYACKMNKEETLELLRSVTTPFTASQLPGARFEPWGR